MSPAEPVSALAVPDAAPKKSLITRFHERNLERLSDRTGYSFIGAIAEYTMGARTWDKAKEAAADWNKYRMPLVLNLCVLVAISPFVLPCRFALDGVRFLKNLIWYGRQV